MSDTIIIAIIGSGALSALIAGIFQLINNRNMQKNELNTVKTDLSLVKKDLIRLNLLVMIKLFPDEITDILRLAEYYFNELKGNWVLTNVFNHWLETQHIAPPEWFKGHGGEGK